MVAATAGGAVEDAAGAATAGLAAADARDAAVADLEVAGSAAVDSAVGFDMEGSTAAGSTRMRRSVLPPKGTRSTS